MTRFALLPVVLAMIAGISRPCLAGSSGAPGAVSAGTYVAATNRLNTMKVAGIPALPEEIRGAFVGVIDGAIVVAGGIAGDSAAGEPANWRYLDRIHVLAAPMKRAPEGHRTRRQKIVDWAKPLLGAARARKVQPVEEYGAWATAEVKLPKPVAFGSAVVRGNMLLCMGGLTEGESVSTVFGIAYDAKNGVTLVKAADKDRVPDLPGPVAFHSAKAMGNSIFVVGGITALSGHSPNEAVYQLDFPAVVAKSTGLLGPLKDWAASREAAQRVPKKGLAWTTVSYRNPDGTTVDPIGNGLLMPLLDVRREEGAYRDALYIMGGRRGTETAGVYGVGRACWKFIQGDESRTGWRRVGDLPEGIEVGSSLPVGPSHLLVLGRKAPPAETPLADVAISGTGGGDFFLYHTFTDSWVGLESESLGGGGSLMGNGGTRGIWVGSATDGLRSKACSVELEYHTKPFGVANAMVIYGFFGALILIGWMCRKKDATTEEYFLSGRKIPWWASGLSMWATGVSAISLMAIPAKTYATDWTYMWLGIFPPVMLSLSAMVFMPLFRRMTIMSMTEYFEMRFHPSIRVFSTFLGVLGHTGAKMSVTLLVPALAMAAVTGWDVYFCVIMMGLVTIIYTVVGGMDAVIWTDVAQSVVMIVAPIVTIAIIIGSLDGGFGQFINVGVACQKFRLVDMSPDLTVATFWVFAIWSLPQFMGVLGQETMQRAWATEGVKAAKRSVYTLAAVSIPGTLLFYSIGASLFAYYKQHPDELNPTINTDGIFPLYIVQSLPPGLSGLMIAAIFAAAISMAMNTSSTMITRDFFRFFFRSASDKTRMRFGWWTTLITGGIATGIAVILASLNSASLWDLFSKLMALVGGGFGGVTVLGVLTKRGSTAGAWIGAVVGTVVLIYLEVFTKTSFFVYGTIALAVSTGVGYVFSLIFPGPQRNLDGLTVWTLVKDGPPAAPDGRS